MYILSQFTRINLKQTSTSLFVPWGKTVEVLEKTVDVSIGLGLIVHMIWKRSIEEFENIRVKFESSLRLGKIFGLGFIFFKLKGIFFKATLHRVNPPSTQHVSLTLKRLCFFLFVIAFHDHRFLNISSHHFENFMIHNHVLRLIECQASVLGFCKLLTGQYTAIQEVKWLEIHANILIFIL